MKIQIVLLSFSCLAFRSCAFQPVSTTIPSIRQAVRCNQHDGMMKPSLSKQYHPSPSIPKTTALKQSVQNNDDIKQGWTIVSINGNYLDPNEMEDYVESCLRNKQPMKFEFQVNLLFSLIPPSIFKSFLSVCNLWAID